MEDERPFSFELVTEVHSAQVEVSRFMTFSDEIEELLEAKSSMLYDQIDSALNSNTGHRDEDVVDWFAEDLHEREVILPSMHRQSLFLTLHGFLDFKLNEIAAAIGRELKVKLKPAELSGRGVHRSINYLEKVIQFHIPQPKKDFMLNAGKLRNRIAHNGGQLPESRNDPTNQFIQPEEIPASGSAGHLVYLEKPFIRHFSERYMEFFEIISSEMSNWMDANA